MERKILIAAEVAELLRVDRQRVYSMARQNLLPVIRCGNRQYRFDAEAIKQWIERGGGSAQTREDVEGEGSASGE